MKKVIAYPLSVIYYIAFGLTLGIFHVIQWLSFNIGGPQAHKVSVDYFNIVLVWCLRILGIRFTFINEQRLPQDKPIIFVSNHQSMYDVSPLYVFLKPYHIKFVAKKELGRWLPGVSYNLNHGGSVVIDRRNPRQAISALKKFSEYIEKNKYSAVIFPEGTRSRDGLPKKFRPDGLKVLMKFAPTAILVPITINNSWKIDANGAFPLNTCINIGIKVHEPIEPGDLDIESRIAMAERSIVGSII